MKKSKTYTPGLGTSDFCQKVVHKINHYNSGKKWTEIHLITETQCKEGAKYVKVKALVSCYFRMTRNNPSSEYLSKNVNCIINLGSKRMRKFFLWSNIQYDFWYKALHSLAVYVRVWTCVSDQTGGLRTKGLEVNAIFHKSLCSQHNPNVRFSF